MLLSVCNNIHLVFVSLSVDIFSLTHGEHPRSYFLLPPPQSTVFHPHRLLCLAPVFYLPNLHFARWSFHLLSADVTCLSSKVLRKLEQDPAGPASYACVRTFHPPRPRTCSAMLILMNIHVVYELLDTPADYTPD